MARLSKPFNDVIARRELGVKDSPETIVVELGRPYAHGNEFACPFRIAFQSEIISREIFGIDAFQALQLALKILSVELHYDDRLPLGRMYWLDPKDDIGFENPEQGK